MSELDKGQYIDEQHVEQSTQKYRDARIAIHNDTYDIDGDALGTNRPKRYYLSPGFIGTVVMHGAMTGAQSTEYSDAEKTETAVVGIGSTNETFLYWMG